MLTFVRRGEGVEGEVRVLSFGLIYVFGRLLYIHVVLDHISNWHFDILLTQKFWITKW
jgi:hypothetical protein